MPDALAAAGPSGGIDRWVEEFDLPRPHRRNGHHHYWTDQRIHAQLTELCDGQEAFPSCALRHILALAEPMH